MHGGNDAELSEEVRSAVSELNSQIQFHIGQENRYLIARKASEIRLVVDVSGARSRRMVQPFEPNLLIMPAFCDPHQKAFSLHATVDDLPHGVPIDIKFSQGAVVKKAGFRFGIGKIFDAVSPHSGFWLSNGFGGRLGWSVIIGADQGGGKWPTFDVAALDRKGREIRYVDVDGNPVSTEDYQAWVQMMQANPRKFAYPYPTLLAELRMFGQGEVTAASLDFNIKPSVISKLRLLTFKETQVKIDGFPADPTPR